MLSSSGAAEPCGIPFPRLLGQPGGHRSHPARRGSEAGPASSGAQPGAARKEAGARGRGEVPAWLPGAGEGVGEEHAGPGACVGTAGLPRLTRGRKRGSCTAACPSWSRTSSLPGWSGRSGEESAGGQRGPRGPLPRSAPAVLLLSTGLVQAPRSSRLRGTGAERGGETLMDSAPPLQPPPASSQHPGREGRGRRVAHRADEASVVPAEPQRLQEPVPSIDLEVAAAALGAKHLLVVCGQRQSLGQRSPSLRPLVSPCSRAQPGDISRPAQDRDKARGARHPGQGVPDRHHAAGRRRTSAPRMQHSL